MFRATAKNANWIDDASAYGDLSDLEILLGRDLKPIGFDALVDATVEHVADFLTDLQEEHDRIEDREQLGELWPDWVFHQATWQNLLETVQNNPIYVYEKIVRKAEESNGANQAVG